MFFIFSDTWPGVLQQFHFSVDFSLYGVIVFFLDIGHVGWQWLCPGPCLGLAAGPSALSFLFLNMIFDELFWVQFKSVYSNADKVGLDSEN